MSGLVERIPGRARFGRRYRPARPLEIDGRPSVPDRVFGLGSIYGKSLRDARRGFLLAGIGIGLLIVFTASQVAAEFGTTAARAAIAALPNQLPVIFRGLLGEPIDIARLAAFLSWRTLNFMTIILGTWSIMAMSSALASEAARGTLDLTLATPRSRRNVAFQKAAAQITAMAIAVALIGSFTWIATMAFATLPGDEVSLPTALQHMVWVGLMGLFPGTVAWFLAPVVGRGAAAGAGAFVMIVSYVVHGYRELVPAFGSLDTISYYGLTAGHRPLAGVTDWPSVGILALVSAGFLVLGLVAFRVRDVGITIDVGLPLPRLRLGLGGPLGRSFAECLPTAVWWGLGIGAFGFVFTLSADSFVVALRSIPQVQDIFNQLFPGIDMFSVGGILQLVFFEFGTLIVIALAGMVASGWASDERERRLELVLVAPVSRFDWGWRSGFGALAAIAAFALIAGVLMAAGTLAQGDDPIGPFSGSLVLGAYAAALVGVGIAVGGLIRPSLAASVAAGLGLAFYLLDVFGSALRLPREIVDLALTNHLGQPMAGAYDLVGTAVCLDLAVGGVVLGAIGVARRDVGR